MSKALLPKHLEQKQKRSIQKMNVALVFAGGAGHRMKNSAKPKQFLEMYGKPIIIYTLEHFEKHPEIDTIVIPCIKGWESYLRELLEKFNIKKVQKILTGGNDTQESKMVALNYLAGICKKDDIVLLHDAVRPLISKELISENLRSVKEFGNAISYVPFTETGITSNDKEFIKGTVLRNTLYVAKAPQSFYFQDVYEAHKKGESMPYTITIDTCSLMTELGIKLHLVPCEHTNIKITTPDDFFIFKALLDLKENRDIFGF